MVSTEPNDSCDMDIAADINGDHSTEPNDICAIGASERDAILTEPNDNCAVGRSANTKRLDFTVKHFSPLRLRGNGVIHGTPFVITHYKSSDDPESYSKGQINVIKALRDMGEDISIYKGRGHVRWDDVYEDLANLENTPSEQSLYEQLCIALNNNSQHEIETLCKNFAMHKA